MNIKISTYHATFRQWFWNFIFGTKVQIKHKVFITSILSVFLPKKLFY